MLKNSNGELKDGGHESCFVFKDSTVPYVSCVHKDDVSAIGRPRLPWMLERFGPAIESPCTYLTALFTTLVAGAAFISKQADPL